MLTLILFHCARLYPEHVNRVVLDGVADATSYYSDFLQYGRAGMADTNKVRLNSLRFAVITPLTSFLSQSNITQTVQGFYSSCAEAGPDRCSLARSSSSASAIEQRVEELFVTVAQKPLPISASAQGTGILTASDLKLFLFVRLYNPKSWPGLAIGEFCLCIPLFARLNHECPLAHSLQHRSRRSRTRQWHLHIRLTLQLVRDRAPAELHR